MGIVYFNIRYMVLSIIRENITQTATSCQKGAFRTIGMVNCLSWAFSSLIFIIRPSAAAHNPTWHTASFVQLVVFQYLVFTAYFFATDAKYHTTAGYIFLPFYGIVSLGFGALAMTQMFAFDLPKFEAEMAAGDRVAAAQAARGPIPWWVMATFDYLWFACIGSQGRFRPPMPSVKAENSLVSDDDFSVESSQEQEKEDEGEGLLDVDGNNPEGEDLEGQDSEVQD